MTPDERIAELEARLAMVVEASMHFIGCVLASRLHNQREFMAGLADDINEFAAALGEVDRCEFSGDGFRVAKNGNAPPAAAPDVTAFLQRVEDRGAAKAIDHLFRELCSLVQIRNPPNLAAQGLIEPGYVQALDDVASMCAGRLDDLETRVRRRGY